MSFVDAVLAVHTEQRPTGRTTFSGGVEYSLRSWSCTLQEGRPKFPNATQLPYVKKVEFVLHETFDNSHKVISRAPFRIAEEGWGEFDLAVIIHFVNCPEPQTIYHDLTFQEGEVYRKTYTIRVPNPTPGFLALFNKHPAVSRKTIPARATKARKGPPKDSAYSNSRRSPPYFTDSSDDLSSSDNSDSPASSSEDDVSEDDRRSIRSFRGRDRNSVSSAASSNSAVARSGSNRQPADTHPNISRKQVSSIDRNKSRDAQSRKLKHTHAGTEPALSSPLSHYDDHRQRAASGSSRSSSITAIKGDRDRDRDHIALAGSAQQQQQQPQPQTSQQRRQREGGPGARRLSSGMAASHASAGIPAKQQRMLDSNGRNGHSSANGPQRPRNANAQPRRGTDLSESPVRQAQKPAKYSGKVPMPGSARNRPSDRSPSPAARRDKLSNSGSAAGTKRRLSDGAEQIDKSKARRRTMPVDQLARTSPTSSISSLTSISPSSSIDSRGSHMRTNGSAPAHKPSRSLVGNISDVKVPKKRTIKMLDDDDAARMDAARNGGSGNGSGKDRASYRANEDPLAKSPRTSRSRTPPPQARRNGARNGEEDSVASLPAVQKASSALSSREAFIRDRERQRHAEELLGNTGSSAARSAKQPSIGSSGVHVRKARSGPSLTSAAAAAGSEKARRAADSSNTSEAAPPPSPPPPPPPDTEPSNHPTSLQRRGSAKREREATAAAGSKPSQRPPPQKTVPTSSTKSRSSEQPSAAAAAAEAMGADKPAASSSSVNGTARTKRAVSQQKVPSDVVDDSVVAKAALSRNKKDLQQQQSEPDLPSPECMEKMERIMVKANGLNERGLVKFLRLLHSLRVEQEPERAAVITEAAIDSVENDGEYSCNLSALGPEAIDKLWALMKEIRV